MLSGETLYCLLSPVMRTQGMANDTVLESTYGYTVRARKQVHFPAEFNLMKHLFKKHLPIKNVSVFERKPAYNLAAEDGISYKEC